MRAASPPGRRAATLAAVALAAVAVAAACSAPSITTVEVTQLAREEPAPRQLPTADTTGATSSATSTTGDAGAGPPQTGAIGELGVLDVLDVLDVLSTMEIARPHDGAPAYDRDAWEHWTDDDGDGCDTREEVLLEEALAPPTVADDCAVGPGRWRSAYDGVVVDDAGALDVDHVVPLFEAHRSGGWAWDDARRAAYANDLSDARALVGVTATTNRAKGDSDPAGWMPAEDVCTYVADWVAVKHRWGLSVDAEEATALSDLLVGPCAGTTMAPWTDGGVDRRGDTPGPAGCHPSYEPCLPNGADLDCDDLVAAGVALPVEVVGNDPYGLDGDGDGVACDG